MVLPGERGRYFPAGSPVRRIARTDIPTIAPKLGCSPDSLRVWCQQAERDRGERGGLTSAEKDRIKELEREVRELRTANEILKSGLLCMGEVVHAS
ncbi:hypothetical protein DPM13_09185 [Paracoccus mutanolyticus]|uniref:Transposase n=1 Tax=Paracoccus mutanolyticus TaxID=1499308 RepID=A0ABM6WRP8_9RHOB|nr:hypothetical protein DPM13_09185 [Paracoccus mutanolyticus]